MKYINIAGPEFLAVNAHDINICRHLFVSPLCACVWDNVHILCNNVDQTDGDNRQDYSCV